MKINETTGIDIWCIKGKWITWDEMTPEQQVAKMAAKKAIKEATGEKDEHT